MADVFSSYFGYPIHRTHSIAILAKTSLAVARSWRFDNCSDIPICQNLLAISTLKPLTNHIDANPILQ
jgi:hypothetical protein